MTAVECPYEQDLLDAIQAARWPGRADPALRSHVAGCPVCRDVAAVAPTLMGGSDADPEHHLPEAGAVWLRAQWRARAEAERTATHPITAAQAAAIACLACVGGALFGATSAWFQTGVSGLAVNLRDLGAWLQGTVSPNGIVALMASHITLALGATLAVLLAPVAAYLATRD
jgi:hypothetical protein